MPRLKKKCGERTSCGLNGSRMCVFWRGIEVSKAKVLVEPLVDTLFNTATSQELLDCNH